MKYGILHMTKLLQLSPKSTAQPRTYITFRLAAVYSTSTGLWTPTSSPNTWPPSGTRISGSTLLSSCLRYKVSLPVLWFPIYQGTGSGYAWICIHFPSWIRIYIQYVDRIQEDKFPNSNHTKCKAMSNHCKFCTNKCFKSKFHNLLVSYFSTIFYVFWN